VPRLPRSPLLQDSYPILALQRSVGNHAVAQLLARKPAVATGSSVEIHGVGQIKVKGGNLEEWTGAEVPNPVDVTSHTGMHSAKLSEDVGRADQDGCQGDDLGGGQRRRGAQRGWGTELEIKGARVEHYAEAGGAETWRLGDFTNVHRTKITHRVS
jgi:hypothetical protein